MSSQANKGKSFEDIVERANAKYAEDGTALIQKIATPVKVIRRYDPLDNKSKIVSAFHEKQSTVDFQGVLKGGRSIAFDAKSTMNKQVFNMSMLEQHQIDYLEKHKKMGGLSFVLIEFTEIGEVYRIEIGELLDFCWENERKSVPIPHFKKFCQKCPIDGKSVLDYLQNLE